MYNNMFINHYFMIFHIPHQQELNEAFGVDTKQGNGSLKFIF
jgi:hypothetical protein